MRKELTDKEQQTIQAIADGLAPKEMGISASGIQQRIARIRVKLGAQTTEHAVAIAIRQGLID